MHMIHRAFVVLAAFALIAGFSNLKAQEPQQQEWQQEQPREGETEVQGELLWVDPDSETFAIRTTPEFDEPLADPGVADPADPADPMDPPQHHDDPAATGETMTFRYDQQTEVEGTADSPAGLAGLAGTRVTVFYEEKDADIARPGIAEPDVTEPDEVEPEVFQEERELGDDAKLATRIIVHGEGEHALPRN